MIIVCAIPWNLAGIGPDILCQIRMIQIQACIYYPHQKDSCFMTCFECFQSVYVRVLGSILDYLRIVAITWHPINTQIPLAGVVQIPLMRKQRIVRLLEKLYSVVQLRIFHFGCAFIFLLHPFQVRPFRNLQDMNTG